MNDQPIVISHHCFGYMQMSYEPVKKFFNCTESKDNGLMTLENESTGECLSVSFCPFCGKESAAHKQAVING